MKVLTCSRHFPKGHPRQGESTWFVEKILSVVLRNANGRLNLDDINAAIRLLVNDFFIIDGDHNKYHTIRAGNRFKPGDMASLRVWSDKPYRSKQIEFAQVEVKKVWGIEINVIQTCPVILIANKLLTYEAGKELAANDGLLLTDFISWFSIHPKKKEQTFTGQIICWSDAIEYGKPFPQTEKSIS